MQRSWVGQLSVLAVDRGTCKSAPHNSSLTSNVLLIVIHTLADPTALGIRLRRSIDRLALASLLSSTLVVATSLAVAVASSGVDELELDEVPVLVGMLGIPVLGHFGKLLEVRLSESNTLVPPPAYESLGMVSSDATG